MGGAGGRADGRFSQRVLAADDFETVHAEAGRHWYDKYCVPCHGAAGAPGSAVYPDTKKPVDLRDYVQRHGGKFPAAQWISVVTTDNPMLIHTKVWQQIRDAQARNDIFGRHRPRHRRIDRKLRALDPEMTGSPRQALAFILEARGQSTSGAMRLGRCVDEHDVARLGQCLCTQPGVSARKK